MFCLYLYPYMHQSQFYWHLNIRIVLPKKSFLPITELKFTGDPLWVDRAMASSPYMNNMWGGWGNLMKPPEFFVVMSIFLK